MSGTEQYFPWQLAKQIGNAVPIPMAEAIGREILKSRLIDWRKQVQVQEVESNSDSDEDKSIDVRMSPEL